MEAQAVERDASTSSRRNVLLTSGGKAVGIVRQLREAMNRHPDLVGERLIVSSSEPFTPGGMLRRWLRTDTSHSRPNVCRADPGYLQSARHSRGDPVI
jgi:hypothetical protein